MPRIRVHRHRRLRCRCASRKQRRFYTMRSRRWKFAASLGLLLCLSASIAVGGFAADASVAEQGYPGGGDWGRPSQAYGYAPDDSVLAPDGHYYYLSEQLDDRFQSHLHQQRKTGAVLCLAGVGLVVSAVCAVQPCGLRRSGRGGPQQPRQHDYHKREESHLHRRGLYRRSLL